MSRGRREYHHHLSSGTTLPLGKICLSLYDLTENRAIAARSLLVSKRLSVECTPGSAQELGCQTTSILKKFVRIQDNGNRPVVDAAYRHFRPELPGFDTDIVGRQTFYKHLVILHRFLGPGSMSI